MTNTSRPATITTAVWNITTGVWEVIDTERFGEHDSTDLSLISYADLDPTPGQRYRVALLDADGNEIDAVELDPGAADTTIGLDDLAHGLDVTRETIDTLVGQIADDPDLYHADTERLTADGADLIRAQVRSGTSDDEPLEQVRTAANRLADAKAAQAAALRYAVKQGHTYRAVAAAADLSPARVHQIVQGD